MVDSNMKQEYDIATVEEQYWNYVFYNYLLQFGVFSNIMMNQIGGF